MTATINCLRFLDAMSVTDGPDGEVYCCNCYKTRYRTYISTQSTDYANGNANAKSNTHVIVNAYAKSNTHVNANAHVNVNAYANGNAYANVNS